MEHSQKIRIFAPEFAVKSIEVLAPEEQEHISNAYFRVVASELGSAPLKDSVLEEFANCLIDVKAVMRFTSLFGPLGDRGPNDTFSFRLAQWAEQQRQFRMTWDRVIGLPLGERTLEGIPDFVKQSMRQHLGEIQKVQADGEFELDETRGLVYRARSLYGALALKLLCLKEHNKLRRCGRPDCDYLPYFIPGHGKQHYCNEKCAAWGQQQWKKAWWEKHGDKWRSNHPAKTHSASERRGGRSQKTGGKVNGTRKT
jgi:hypothetical protein